MKRDGRSSSHDPTAERAVDQSTPGNSLTTGGRPDGGPSRADHADQNIGGRSGADPQPRHEQPLEADEASRPET